MGRICVRNKSQKNSDRHNLLMKHIKNVGTYENIYSSNLFSAHLFLISEPLLVCCVAVIIATADLSYPCEGLPTYVCGEIYDE